MRSLQEIDRDIAALRKDEQAYAHTKGHRFSPIVDDELDDLYAERMATLKALGDAGLKKYKALILPKPESETAASVAAAEEEFEDQLDSIREKYGIAGSASAASSSGSSGFTLDVSELTFDGESIITSTEKDMREYDYIKDVTIQVDKDEIDILFRFRLL